MGSLREQHAFMGKEKDFQAACNQRTRSGRSQVLPLDAAPITCEALPAHVPSHAPSRLAAATMPTTQPSERT